MAIDKLKLVKAWLNLPFYKERCQNPKHATQYPTFYCTVCMKPPLCKLCWAATSSTQHQGHHALKVYIASWRTTVEVGELSKYLDVSGIHEHRINYHQVLYLKPLENKKDKENSHPNSKHAYGCQVCNGMLKHSKYKFCSIACKISTMNTDVAVENNLPEMDKSSKRKRVTTECDHEKGGCSFRKRSRKEIPRRAPFF